jgi:hypothetical protein
MATDEDTILSLIRAISEPVFVIVPNAVMPDEDMVRIFKALEEVLTKIEEKAKVKFDVLVESAVYFGGYNEMSEIASEQREDLGDGIITE